MVFSKIKNLFLFLRKKFGHIRVIAKSIIMIAFIYIYPEKAYLFSTRKHFPKKKNKFNFEEKKDIPFNLEPIHTTYNEFWDEINIVAKGQSFNKQEIKNFTLPTFLIGFWSPLQLDQENNIHYKFIHATEIIENEGKYKKKIENYFKEKITFKNWDNLSRKYRFEMDEKNKYENILKKKNLYYVVPAPVLKKFAKLGLNVISLDTLEKKLDDLNAPLTNTSCNNSKNFDPTYLNLCKEYNIPRISIIDLLYKPPRPKDHPRNSPVNSVVCALSAFSYFAKKINVYGWDFYLSKSPDKMSTFEILKSLLKKELILYRDEGHIESAAVNYYFGYHFSTLDKFDIKSHLGGLNKHKNLMKKIERVIYSKN